MEHHQVVMLNVCFFTGTRADYGLLRPLMLKAKAAERINLQILASGSHLSSRFGKTISEIEADGFQVQEKIDILQDSQEQVALCASAGLGVQGYGEALQRLQPHCVVILGDRYEALSMAFAATLMSVPIVHLHGGESTLGLIDEAIRHAITKMSYLHFASTEKYRDTILQLGESPDRVYNVGALGVENIRSIELVSREEVYGFLGLEQDEQFFLITFHPETLSSVAPEEQVRALLEALDDFPQYACVFTGANADYGGTQINRMIAAFVDKAPQHRKAFTSLGLTRYLSAMQFCSGVVGNSSSGIIETPSFGVATVNIGDRQLERVAASSVIHCDNDADSIEKAIAQAVSEEFAATAATVQNPYEQEHTSDAILAGIVKHFPIQSCLKPFYYIPST